MIYGISFQQGLNLQINANFILFYKNRKMFIYMFLFFFTSVTYASICNVLSLSGGGSFGAVEMGMLEGLSNSGVLPKKYDIITGISAGGLNAGFLSYYEYYADAFPLVRSIFQNLTTPDVYTTDILGILTHWSIYDNSPLKNTLSGIFSGLSNVGIPHMTLIGASNVDTQHLDIYHFDNLTFTDKINVLLSTSAIPFVFPPHNYNGNLYVDGGVISDELITQVVGQIPCDFYNVTFLSAEGKNTGKVVVNGLFSYVSAVFHLLSATFDNQLARNSDCKYPIGSVYACYPDGILLQNYSILDFNHGMDLYNIGYRHHTCETLPLCG